MSVDGPALLVVDDNDDNRYTLTRRLRCEGHLLDAFIVHSSREDALAKL